MRTNSRHVIPPLYSGGVMLSYRCSSACRHCLYRCSPARPDEWMSLEMAERVFDALAAEPARSSIHLAGGEATLRFDCLLDVVRLAVAKDIRIDYLETNAGWCADRGETREKLLRLRHAGLRAVLVSASPFHNEFIPFSHTRQAVEEAQGVFGRQDVIVWQPHIYEILSAMPAPEKTHTLKEFCEHLGMDQWDRRLPPLYHLIPGGRAPEALRRCYPLMPAKKFRGDRCRDTILSAHHFHIDLHGRLFTGFCAGLSAGHIDDLHPELTADAFPLLHTLCERGPYGLMEIAQRDHGFEPDKEGYASKCDLCYRVRRHLHDAGEFPELRPGEYYTCR